MESGDLEAIKQALLDPKLQLKNFDEKNLTHYMTLLTETKEKKSKVSGLHVISIIIRLDIEGFIILVFGIGIL